MDIRDVMILVGIIFLWITIIMFCFGMEGLNQNFIDRIDRINESQTELCGFLYNNGGFDNTTKIICSKYGF